MNWMCPKCGAWHTLDSEWVACPCGFVSEAPVVIRTPDRYAVEAYTEQGGS